MLCLNIVPVIHVCVQVGTHSKAMPLYSMYASSV